MNINRSLRFLPKIGLRGSSLPFSTAPESSSVAGSEKVAGAGKEKIAEGVKDVFNPSFKDEVKGRVR
ncbi:MAG: hypothetical protein JSS09_02570, partial [Verrucomicrobia bacterium]|nr:hypothetical protein [Verrucomicrobiota bacterium]